MVFFMKRLFGYSPHCSERPCQLLHKGWFHLAQHQKKRVGVLVESRLFYGLLSASLARRLHQHMVRSDAGHEPMVANGRCAVHSTDGLG